MVLRLYLMGFFRCVNWFIFTIFVIMKSWTDSSAVQGRCGEPSQNRAHAGIWCSDRTVDCTAPAAGSGVTVSPQHLPLRFLVDFKPLQLGYNVYCFLYRTQLSEAKDKMLAVQECYISVCREKNMLEDRIHNREKEEILSKENEVSNKRS